MHVLLFSDPSDKKQSDTLGSSSISVDLENDSQNVMEIETNPQTDTEETSQP